MATVSYFFRCVNIFVMATVSYFFNGVNIFVMTTVSYFFKDVNIFDGVSFTVQLKYQFRQQIEQCTCKRF